MGKPSFNNRLVAEKSPYLLQHAHNPVDWYPWGEEAFQVAKREDKPIFLSIGYATCHWCHVMEKESFENVQIAQQMNASFVNIKVDREELPEVDSLYMEFAQTLMSSSGGWPLNLVLTPDLKPFFAVTYLPPENRRGLIGIGQFIEQINQLWKGEERPLLFEQADKIVNIFEKSSQETDGALPLNSHIPAALEILYTLIDPVNGGFKGAPKFPLGYQVLFLLDYARAEMDSRAIFCVEISLDHMLQGGIYDQLGGGFSRYSVDAKWLIPHFEKMLYDNAILASVYLEAWKYTKKASYKTAVLEILGYILADMTREEGGFYSAEDADSDGHEGMFYTWTKTEVREILSDEDAKIFCEFYGVSHEGTFEGRNVLHIITPLEEFAQTHGIALTELSDSLVRSKKQLLKQRNFRTRPFKDDKILCSWNGLMIDAMIRAASALKQDPFKQAALKAASFIQTHLFKDGKLLRRFRDNEARFSGNLDDYAFLIKGLLSLFEADCGSNWLQWAIALSDVVSKDLSAEGGGFYYTDADPHLLIRKKEYYDGAEPSGNAVHCENLLRLYQITQNRNYLEQAEGILKAAKIYIENYPPGACYHLTALQRYFDKSAKTLVIAVGEESSLTDEISTMIANLFTPHTAVIWKREGDSLLKDLIPSLVDKNSIDGQTAIYMCQQDSCSAPLMTKGDIFKAINKEL